MTDATNPKDAVAARKVGLSVLPVRVLYEVALALLEGALKYGAFNWRRSRVKVMVYVDAAKRHLDQFVEGQDMDLDMPVEYRIHHVSKAIAGLMIVRDAMLRGSAIDDRPPPSESEWLGELNQKAEAVAKAVKTRKRKPVQKRSARRVHR